MGVIDRGSGIPLVLVPGIQGRWEYLGPAVEALAASFRVVTSSDFADDVEAIGHVLDERHMLVRGRVIYGVDGIGFEHFAHALPVMRRADERHDLDRQGIANCPVLEPLVNSVERRLGDVEQDKALRTKLRNLQAKFGPD